MSRQTATRQVTVSHAAGLHARPCLAIVNTVRRFQAEVTIRNGGREANAGAILEVMSLGVPHGSQVTLQATGADADQALDALEKLFSDNFGFDD